jgi:hypothetical protein
LGSHETSLRQESFVTKAPYLEFNQSCSTIMLGVQFYGKCFPSFENQCEFTLDVQKQKKMALMIPGLFNCNTWTILNVQLGGSDE